VRNSTNTEIDFFKNNFYFISLIFIVSAIILIKLFSQQQFGPGWDTYSFSINALEYAGQGTGYYEYSRGPFFPFIVSLFYRMGYVDESIAMMVDSMFLIFGSIMLYKLVELKCPKSVAFLAGLIFATSEIMISWSAVGYADITSVAMSILAIYLFIKGVEDDHRYLLLSWPVAMCAFLTRTTAALIILPMLLYFIFIPLENRSIKYNILGMIIGGLVYLPVALFYSANNRDPLSYVMMVFEGLSASGDSIGTNLEMYNQGPYYYLENMGEYIVDSQLYPVILIVAILGIAFLAFRYISISTKKPNTILLLIFFMIIFYYVYGKYTFKFLEILLLLMFMYFYYYTRPKISDNKALFCLMMLFWGFSYFLFHSNFYQKVPRYYITMMPGISFIMALAVYEFGRIIGIVTDRKRLIASILIMFMTFSFIYTSASVIDDIAVGEDAMFVYDDALDMVEWINANVDDFDESLVYSDYWVAFGWYFKKNILSMPIYFDGGYFNHELMKYGVDYYLTYRPQEFSSCEELYRTDEIRLLKLITQEDKPKGLFVGNGWENYFEYLLDFSCYLYTGEKHIGEVGDYIDDFSIEELNGYDFLALFDFKWIDSNDTEMLLKRYVEDGGTVFIDCSGNLDDPVFSLNYVQFFDMLIYRNSLPVYSEIVFHDTPKNYGFSNFSYDGAPWYGATYTPVWSSKDIRTVATVNEEILVAIQEMGEGEIVWMGYNIIYHAFLYDNPSEMEFLQYLIDVTVNS